MGIYPEFKPDRYEVNMQYTCNQSVYRIFYPAVFYQG